MFEKMNVDEYQGDGDLSSASSVFMTDSSTVSESEYDISAGTLTRVEYFNNTSLKISDILIRLRSWMRR